MPDIPSTKERLKEVEDVMKAGIYLRPDTAPCTQTIERVRQLAEMLSSGKSDVKVRKYLMDEYSIKDERAVKGYMEAAYRLLMPQDWNEEKERLIAKNVKTLEHIIDKCLDKENYKVAREAIDSLNKMMGLSGNAIAINKQPDGSEQIIVKFD